VDPARPDPADVATDTPRTPAPAGDAPVLITFAGWQASAGVVEVGGFVDQVVESDGSCTATLTNGQRTVSASRPATPDATTTSCGWLSVPGHDLAPGTWTAVLSYASRTSTGASAEVEVVVP